MQERRIRRLFSQFDIEEGAGKPAKKFYFSSRANQMILDGAINDAAYLDDLSFSEVIEDALIARFIPTNARARRIVCSLYLGEVRGGSKKYSIQDSLCSLFRDYAAGANWEARWPNGRTLVRFARDVAADNGLRVCPDSGSVHHSKGAFGSIVDRIEGHYRKELGIDSLVGDALTEVTYGRGLCESLYQGVVQVVDGFDYILRHWAVVGNLTWTYRSLTTLFETFDPWPDTSADRFALKAVLDELAKGWDDEGD